MSDTPIAMPGGQRPQLLEPLDLLERTLGQLDPPHQRRPVVRVHADVLPHPRPLQLARPPESRRYGIGAREKYMARPSSAATTLTTFGIGENLRAAPSPRPCRAETSRRSPFAPRRARRARDTNGSSPWTLTITSNPANSGAPRHLGDAMGAGRMCCARQDGLAAVGVDDLGDLVAVGGHDDPVGDADLGDALPDADDQRKAGEQAERLSGETRGAQSSWDDGERPHTWRSVRRGT